MRTNVATKTQAPKTHEGATASRITPEQQLRRVIMACMLFENSFYIDGQTSASLIDEAVAKVIEKKGGPKFVSDLAIEARKEGKLRHAPLYLALALVRAGNKNTVKAQECRGHVADTIIGVIQRPDEMAEFLSLYWDGNRTPISNQVKKGLAASFQKFNEYQLSKYANRDGNISMRDVLFLTHPKPLCAEQEKLFKKLANKELKAPDTWESNLSGGKDKKETFTRLLEEGKLGALALLRNLRNMQQSGVPPAVIKEGIKKMNTERVLPFRFVSAAKYAPNLEPQLEEAMFKSLEGFKKLSGRTILMVDNSGSMHGSSISEKSELDRSDAACALAMLLREISEDVRVVVFGSTAGEIPPRRGFALRDHIKGSSHQGGTDTEKGKKLADKLGYDRLIIFTDEQSHTKLSDPLEGSKGYVINVDNCRNGIGYDKWVHIDGFSESCVDFISEYEKG